MSDEKNFVPSPVSADYKIKNSEAIESALGLSKLNTRVLGSKDKVTELSSPSNFKFFETTLFSTKDVEFVESDPSMLDDNFIEVMRKNKDRTYHVIRFDRSHNIKSFDFTLTYNQIADWGADKFKSIPTTRTFIGSMIFTGCSNIKNTATYENIPLEAHIRFESIGDGMGSETSVDGFGDNKGGPSVTFKYSYTKDYVYLFVSSINPFRLIPKEDGTFVDISYAEGRGLFIGENKENETVKDNRLTGSTKNIAFSPNKDIHCELGISIKDTSISSTKGKLEIIDINSPEFKDNESIIEANGKTFTIRPTKGEVVTYGMTPSSDVDLEIAAEVSPIKYTSRLLIKDMDKVNKFIGKLENLIKDSSTTVDEIPFTIKTIIREKGKYNARGDFFLDSEADGFGKVLITEMGKYNAKTDKFEITEFVFDSGAQTGNETVKGYLEYAGENASPFLKSIIKDNPNIKHNRKTDKIMSLIREVNFEEPDNLNVYSEISFIRSSFNFDCVKPFVELKSDNGVEDRIVYFNKDRSVVLCNFKDYDMEHPIVLHPFEDIGITVNKGLINKFEITDVVRYYDDVNKRFVYKICTNLGLIYTGYYDDSDDKVIRFNYANAFVKDAIYATSERITSIYQDDDFIVFSGDKGNVSIFDIKRKEMTYIDSILDADEKVLSFDYGTINKIENLKYYKSIKDRNDIVTTIKLKEKNTVIERTDKDTTVELELVKSEGNAVYTPIGLSSISNKMCILYEKKIASSIDTLYEVWIETDTGFVNSDVESDKLTGINVIENIEPVLLTSYDPKDIFLFATTKRVVTYDWKNKSWVSDISLPSENTRYDHGNLGINDNTDNIPCAYGFKNVSSIQVGGYRYYMGLRYDTSGYSGVYKRIELNTGKVTNISKPKLELFKPILATDGRYIYSIGGSARNETSVEGITVGDDLFEHVLKYDTVLEEWVDLTTDKITLTSDSGKYRIVNGKPIVIGNDIYFFKPEVLYLALDASEQTVPSKTYDNSIFKINVTNESLAFEIIPIAELPSVSDLAKSLYPVNYANDKILLITGTRVLERKPVETVMTDFFKFYKIDFVEYDLTTKTLSIKKSIELSNTYFDEIYSGNRVDAAKTDLFYKSPIAVSEEKALCFTTNGFYSFDLNKLEAYFIPLYKEDNTSSTPELIDSGRLIEKNEYNKEWNEFSRNDNQIVDLSFVGKTKAMLIGGTTLRLPVIIDVTDISHITLFETATTIPRVEDSAIPEGQRNFTSIFNATNIRDYIRVVSTFGLKSESVGIAESGNHVFMMLKQKGYLTPAVYYLNKGADKHFIWMRDAVTAGNTDEQYFSDYKGFVIGKFAIFCPESVNKKFDEGKYIKDSSGTITNAPIVVYDTVTRNFGSVIVDESIKNRFILHSELYNQAVLVYETNDNRVKGLRFIYDRNSDSITTEKFAFPLDTTLDIPVLQEEWKQKQSILTGGSFGSKSYVVSSNGIAVFNFDDLLQHKLVYSTFDDLFEENVPSKAVTQDSKYIYISGGLNEKTHDENHSLYKIKIDDLADNRGYVTKEYSVLSSPTSSTMCPIYNTAESLFVFGKMAYSDYMSRGVVRNYKKDEIKFTNVRNVIHLNKINSSQFNRHYPEIHSTNFNGHQVLIVFSGRQGLNTDITKEVDMFDMSRRHWVSLPSLPVTLKDVKFIDNCIVGAIKVNEDTSEVPYMHKLELVCNNFDKYDFKWVDTTFAEATSPLKFVTCENKETTKIALVGTDDSGYLLNSENTINIYNKTEEGIYTPEVIPSIELNSLMKYRVLSVYFTTNNDLQIALFNETSVNNKQVDLWKYTSTDGWTIVTSKVIEGISTEKGYIKSSHEYFQGLVNIDSKSAYIYIVENKVHAIWFSDTTIESTELLNTKKVYNDSNITDLFRYSAFTYSLEGWIFLFDTNTNEYYGITPSLYGFNSYTTYKDTVKGRCTSINNGNYYKIIEGDKNNLSIVETNSITGKELSTVIKVDNGFLVNVSASRYILYKNKYLAVLSEVNSTLDVYDLVEGKTLTNYTADMVSPGYKFDQIKDFSFLEGENGVIYISLIKSTETNINSIIFEINAGKVVLKPLIEINLTTTFDYKLVHISGTKTYYVSITDRKSLYLLEFDGTANVKTKEYLYDANSIVLIEKSGEFYLYDKINSKKSITRCYIDVNDTENPLYYRSNVLDRSLYDMHDIILTDNNLYSISNGIKIALTKQNDVDINYLNYDKTLSRSFELGNYIVRFTKVYLGTEGEDANYGLGVYDKFNSHNVITDLYVSKDPEDADPSAIELPLDTDEVFTDVIDKILYVFIVSKTGTIFKINSINGTVLRIVNPELVNSKLYLFDNNYHKAYLLLEENKYKIYNTITNKFVSKTINTDCKVTEILEAHSDYLRIAGTIDGNPFIQVVTDTGVKYSKHDNRNSSRVLHYANPRMVVEKYERCGENRLGTELSVTRTSNFVISRYFGNETLNVHSIKDGYESNISAPVDTQIAWITEISSIIFIGYKTNAAPVSLGTIKAVKRAEGEYRYIEKSFDITNGGYTELPKCCGIALGVTTDKFVTTDLAPKTYESHIVLANNANTNRIYEIILEYDPKFNSALEAFDELKLRENNIEVGTSLSDDNIHKFHLIPAKNNSVIVLGDSSETSNLIIFRPEYGDREHDIRNFAFTRQGSTLFAYSTMDTIYVGTTLENSEGGSINAYELMTGDNGILKRQNMLGNMVLPKMLTDIHDVIVEADNDRMPSVESVVTFCPVILFMDNIIPTSEYNQVFLGSDYTNSGNRSTIKSLTPIKAKFENGIPVVYFYSNSKDPYKRMLKMGVKDKLYTNKYMNYFTPTSDGVNQVYANSDNPTILRNCTADYYESLITKTPNNALVKITDKKSVSIKDDDGSYIEFTGSDYPFENTIIEKVFGYGERDGKKEIRFLVFVDIKGNVSTYDRQLKRFVDVNGEVNVNIPYFSSEIKLYPSKITESGDVAKRVWAYSAQNPYKSVGDIDKISKTDMGLFD